ncbi:MAG: hypothetical protein HY848_12110 [Betaproteobacteria bacterium]|nr:hypothetical protein [Betaproteobacteria bacterium]
MSDAVQKLSEGLDAVDRLIRKIKARHVNTKAAKDSIRILVRNYFEEWRPSFVAVLGTETELSVLDQTMQELLRFTQRRTRVADYREAIAIARRALGELELRLLQPGNQRSPGVYFETRHQRIVESLRRLSPSAANYYEQGLLDIQTSNRKSWRGTTVEFRESLREVLDCLAPDEEVMKQPNFKLEPDTKGPTMKQKAVFILRARHPKDPQIKTLADAVDVVEGLISKFVRSVYTRSSVGVHIADSKEEASKVRDYVSLVLSELLEIKE